MTIQKREWEEFCDELKKANGFEARRLLLRGPIINGEPRRDWPFWLPGRGAEFEVELVRA